MDDFSGRSAGQISTEAPDRRKGWFAAGGIFGALLAASCCIVPLVLVTLGISGAWIGNLTALEPYRPYSAALALVFIGLGFRHVYYGKRRYCPEGSYCARPQSAILTKIVLWAATILVLLALTVSWWAPLFY